MKFRALILATAVMMLVSVPAWAACVEDSNTYCLDNSNTQQLQGKVVVQVDVTNAANATIHITIAENTTGLTPLGFDFFGYNDGPDLLSDNDPSGDWSDTGSGQQDGFGTFDHRLQLPSGDSTDIIFTLDGLATFDSGSLFAAHIRFGNDCSGWFGNGTTNESNDNPNCGTTEVPEPGSLALLGTGLFSAIGVLRRKLIKA